MGGMPGALQMSTPKASSSNSKSWEQWEENDWSKGGGASNDWSKGSASNDWSSNDWSSSQAKDWSKGSSDWNEDWKGAGDWNDWKKDKWKSWKDDEWGDDWKDWDWRKRGKGKGDGKGRRRGKGDDLEVVIKGLPAQTEEAAIREFFSSCGEVTRITVPRSGKMIFVAFSTQEGVDSALGFNKTFFNGIYIEVKAAAEKYEAKRSNDDLTVVVKGFPDTADEASLSAHFGSCGEGPVRVNVPRHRDTGNVKGAAFVEMKDEESLMQALQLDGSSFLGAPLTVRRATDAIEKGAGKGKRDKEKEDEVSVVVKGFPIQDTDEETLRNGFMVCGEVVRIRLPRGSDGLPKGTAFVQFSTEEQVQRALELDGQDIFGSGNISVHRANEKRKDHKDKEKNDDFTVVVRGLPDWVQETQLKSDFGSCGPLKRVSVPKDNNGNGKGFGYVQYKSDDAVNRALEWHNTWYKGVQITVEKLGADKGRGRGGRRDRKERLPEGPTVNVSGLSYEVDDEMLKQAFAACGEVVACRVNISNKGRSKGKSRGTGLVVFATEEAQKKAVETMDQMELSGRTITVKERAEEA
ncbi:Polyadenylate-binding protein, partial [Durusdinium trenchii]